MGLFTCFVIVSQNDPQAELFKQKIEKCTTADVSDCAVEYGTSFLGSPYVSHTLEQGEEKLVVNLDKFDCATFVETVLALANTSVSGTHTYEAFTANLQKLRYRGGKIDGYPSRIHYFTDWMYENTKNGFLQNVSEQIGGVRYEKNINFMSTHTQAYESLKDNEENVNKIKEVEANMKGRALFYIPKAQVKAVESKILEGDVIGITSSVASLDISHEGFAVKKNGRIYLLHASSDEKKVVITSTPLHEYLLAHKTQTGIMVCRPLNPM